MEMLTRSEAQKGHMVGQVHRNFPVVKVYYEKNDPDASGMAIYDSSVGISLQLGYVDIMRPLQAICNIKQKWGTPPWTEDAFVEDIVEDLTKVGDTKLKKDVVKEEFPTLLRTLSANVEDLEKKKFNSFSISSKRGTYYINETVEENGDRKTHFQEHTMNMPSTYNMIQQFSKSVATVLKSSYERSTSHFKKLVSRCMMFGVHLKCMCGDMEKVKIQDDLKKVIVQCLVEDPQLRTTGIKVTSANKIIDDLHKQLTSLLNEDLTSSSLIIKSKWFQTFKISDDAFSSYEYGDLNISTKCRIVKIETIEQKYYD